jgi:hypothetical protein
MSQLMLMNKLTQENLFLRDTWKNCLGTIVPRRSSERRKVSSVVKLVLESCVDEMPFTVRRPFYFEQDGAPHYFAGELRSSLE